MPAHQQSLLKRLPGGNMIKNYADHSANERTFLAWVRTAIAIVGFGLGAGRLGDPAANNVWSEILLLGSAGLVILLAYLRMWFLRRRIIDQRALDDAAIPIDTLMILLVVALFGMLGAFAWHTS